MDAVAGKVEADPGDADGVVGAGRDAQAFADGGSGGVVGVEGRVEGVFGVLRPDADVQGAVDGAFGFVGGDGTGELGGQGAVLCVGAEGVVGEADFEAGEGREAGWARRGRRG